MGGSASKQRSRSSRSEKHYSSSRRGYIQEFSDYLFGDLLPTTDEDELSSVTSGHVTTSQQPLPSAPKLQFDEEEDYKIDNMAINSSTYDDDEEEEKRQIDMAIRASMKANSTLKMKNPSSSSAGSSNSKAKGREGDLRRELGGCGICYEDIAMPAICDPCGHVSCYDCLLRIQGSSDKCPRCRAQINKVMRIYM